MVRDRQSLRLCRLIRVDPLAKCIRPLATTTLPTQSSFCAEVPSPAGSRSGWPQAPHSKSASSGRRAQEQSAPAALGGQCGQLVESGAVSVCVLGLSPDTCVECRCRWTWQGGHEAPVDSVCSAPRPELSLRAAGLP